MLLMVVSGFSVTFRVLPSITYAPRGEGRGSSLTYISIAYDMEKNKKKFGVDELYYCTFPFMISIYILVQFLPLESIIYI